MKNEQKRHEAEEPVPFADAAMDERSASPVRRPTMTEAVDTLSGFFRSQPPPPDLRSRLLCRIAREWERVFPTMTTTLVLLVAFGCLIGRL